jgi:hypothetical protein
MKFDQRSNQLRFETDLLPTMIEELSCVPDDSMIIGMTDIQSASVDKQRDMYCIGIWLVGKMFGNWGRDQ